MIEAFNLIIEFILNILAPLNISEAVLQFMLVSAILGVSIYLTLYTGMFSLANAGFMAIGAYVSVLLTQQLEWGLAPAIFGGMIAAGLVAIPIGLPVLRLNDIYLAIATIGFGEVVRILALNFDGLMESIIGALMRIESIGTWLLVQAETSEILDITIRDSGTRIKFELLNGARGIKPIPKLTETWMLVLFLLVLAFLMVRLQRSRFGRAMAAVRQDEKAAANMGINVVYVKNVVFILSAILAGAAGGFSGHLTRIVIPSTYDFGLTVDILTYAVLGGTSTWLGPIVGAMVLTALPETLRVFNEARGLINGLLLLFVIVYLPGGLVNPEGILSLFRKQAQPETQPELAGENTP